MLSKLTLGLVRRPGFIRGRVAAVEGAVAVVAVEVEAGAGAGAGDDPLGGV